MLPRSAGSTRASAVRTSAAARMDRPHCPSARPEWNGSFIFGISAGSVDEPRVVFLDAPLEVTDEIRQMTEGVALTEVFRFAAPCVNAACQQYAGGRCTLSRRTV